MTHDLKVLPKHFNSVADGSKPFEIRWDDRFYAVSDTLRLREWTEDGCSGAFTGRYRIG